MKTNPSIRAIVSDEGWAQGVLIDALRALEKAILEEPGEVFIADVTMYRLSELRAAQQR